MHIQIPGATCVHVIALYTATPEAHRVLRTHNNNSSSSSSSSSARSEDKRAWQGLLEQFWMAEDAFCNERFKLIPFIAEGSWAIKMAVGQKPALLGKKLTQAYTRGLGYLEGEDAAYPMYHTPFTIHHTPYIMLHTPYTIHPHKTP
ncbi:DUF1336 domain-containing protein [archaeon]|nr:MAG: DUF1336 domain-containing protein [archaeon]